MIQRSVLRHELSQQRALRSQVLIRRELSFLDHCIMSYVRLCHHKSVHTVSITVRNNCNIQQIFKKTQVVSLTKSAIYKGSVPSEGGAHCVSASSPTMNIFGQLFAAIVTETRRYFSQVIPSSVQHYHTYRGRDINFIPRASS